MSGVCAACQGADLRLRWRVAHSGGDSLVPTTTRYGSAPADIVACARCGHMQVAEFPAAAQLEEAYEEVSEAAYLEEEDGQRATARRALAEIERYAAAPPGAVVDLGCWLGFLVSEAERRGWVAWGVEPSAFAAAFARERFGLRVSQGTLEEADLPEGHFDAAVLGDVIEHLPDPGSALDRIRRLLKPAGTLYLALPDAGSRVARLLGARWWSVLPTHVQYFTRRSIATLLDRHGYRVQSIKTAPKAFTVRYYLERLEGYSKPLAETAVTAASRAGLADRLVWPDFRDRMAVIARAGDV